MKILNLIPLFRLLNKSKGSKDNKYRRFELIFRRIITIFKQKNHCLPCQKFLSAYPWHILKFSIIRKNKKYKRTVQIISWKQVQSKYIKLASFKFENKYFNESNSSIKFSFVVR